MPFDTTIPQNGQQFNADVVRDQLNALKALIDAAPVPAAETDPVFTASEAAQLVPGDKNKLDSAVQPGSNVSALTNDAKYLVNPMSTNAPGDMVYTMWSDSSPGAVMNARLPIGTPGQILSAVPGWQNGTGVFPAWRDLAGQNVGYTPANPEKLANAPASVAEAIDRMATAMAALLGTPIP